MTNPKLGGAFCGDCGNLLFVDSDTGREYVIVPTPDNKGEAIPHEEICDAAKKEAPLSEQGLTVKPKDVMFTDNIKEF